MLIALIVSAMLSDAARAPAAPAVPARIAAAPRIDTSKTEIRLPASSVAGVVPQGVDDEIVCRKEQLLGSRIFKTVCEQKSVAEERRLLEQEAVRHIQTVAKMGHP